VSDLVLVVAFPNEPEAQVAAAALRSAGLHPVVLGHDPLAQLLDPVRAARILVPAEERAAAREILGIAGEAPLAVAGPRGFEPYAAAMVTFTFLIAAYTAPRLLPVLAIAAIAGWLAIRWARDRELGR
jgi:hypothetical protein